MSWTATARRPCTGFITTFDGDRIYASDINQGIYVLDLIEGG